MAAKKKKAAKKKAAKKKAPAKKEPAKKKAPKKLSEEKLVEMAGAAAGNAPALSPTTEKLMQGPQLHRALKVFMDKQNKDAGHRVMAYASDVPNTYELRRPSGIMTVDLDTGGGFPAGGLSYISGPDNAGKTFLMMLYMLMHQLLYGDRSSLAYACAEGGFDFKRAMNVGMKIRVPDAIKWEWSDERAQIGYPTVCERPRVVDTTADGSPITVPYGCTYNDEEWEYFNQQIGEFVLLGGVTGEQILQSVLGAVRHKLFGIICVDSVSVLLPTADAGKDLDEHNKMAAQASMITDFIKHYTPMTSGLDGINHTTLIFSSQVRANPDRSAAPMARQKYIKKWAPTGAYSARHGKLIDISIWPGEKIVRQVNGEKTIVGKQTKYEITKGKAGAHDNVSGEFPFYYDFALPQGVDRLDTIIVSGIQRGVIVEDGQGTVTVMNPHTNKPSDLGPIPGMANFKTMMDVDITFELAVRHYVLASKGIMCLYR